MQIGEAQGSREAGTVANRDGPGRRRPWAQVAVARSSARRARIAALGSLSVGLGVAAASW